MKEDRKEQEMMTQDHTHPGLCGTVNRNVVGVEVSPEGGARHRKAGRIGALISFL